MKGTFLHIHETKPMICFFMSNQIFLYIKNIKLRSLYTRNECCLSVDLRKNKTCLVYNDLNSLVLPEDEWGAIPWPCVMIGKDKEMGFYQRLISSKMAVLVHESHVPRGPGNRKLLSGVFVVAHKADSDRLVFDRRLQNATEARLQWAKMPHGKLFCQLRLDQRRGG